MPGSKADRRPAEQRVSNNLVLEKLREGFAFKDADIRQVFAGAARPRIAVARA